MKQRTIVKAVLCFSLTLVILSTVDVSAQPPRRNRLTGDWLMKSEFNGRTRETILTFSRDEERNLTGALLDFRGLTELNDVNFTDDKLSFTQSRQNRNGETITSTFTGTITDGVLAGTMTGGRRDYELKGSRIPRMPRAVGDWQIKYTMDKKEVVSTLKIRADAEGKLSATWPSDKAEHTVTEVSLNRRDLTFKRTTKMDDQQWESTFTGTLRGDEITGTLKSEKGDIKVTGTRLGADLIGTWNLDVTSERGKRKQRLVVNPDMSGWYGSTHVNAIKREGDKVSFIVSLGFGDRTFIVDFTGKLADGKLTGELASDRDLQKVSGTKVPRRRRQRTTN